MKPLKTIISAKVNLIDYSKIIALLILMLPPVLCSCHSRKGGSVYDFRNSFKSFFGSEVKIPPSVERILITGISDQDTMTIFSPVPRLIAIINADCESCIAELTSWRVLLLSNPGIEESDVHFVFLSKNKSTLIEKYLIDFPPSSKFYLDEDYRIILENSIPPDSRFYTFLLNPEGRIVLLGAPYSSEKLLSMYISQLNSLKK